MLKPYQWMILACLLFTGCTTGIINYSVYAPFCLTKKIAIIPFTNNTETPLVGERAMSITAGVLESKGIHNLVIYAPHTRKNEILPGMTHVASQKELIHWAKSVHAHYVITGQVNEWTYKVGLDGEPVVGIAIQLIDLDRHAIVWAAVGSKNGGSRVAVSTIAQRLINELVHSLVKK